MNWITVNARCELNPTMIRYADDLVILCRKGQAYGLKERLNKYLSRKGLELNQEKTRIIDSKQESFEFLGFRINWRTNAKSGKKYPHTEPSSKARQRVREKVRKILNHWTMHYETEEAVSKVNEIVRGWSEYYHYMHSSRVFAGMQRWLEDRLNRWLWRKHKCRRGLWQKEMNKKVGGQHKLYRLPLTVKY